MKKIVFFSLFLLIITIAPAQKTWFVGGTTSIGYVDNFTFSFEPQFGYEIAFGITATSAGVWFAYRF